MKKSLLVMAAAMACAQGALAAAVTAPEVGKDYYILNAANNEVYLTYNNTNVVLSKADDAKYQRVQFDPAKTEGAYHIRLADGQYLTTDGQWSTIMSIDVDDPNTEVTIEAASDDAVKIKFVGTEKYLGSDDANDGKGIYTDKDGAQAKFQWVITEAPVITVPNADKMYRIYNVESNNYIVADGNYQRAAYAKTNKQIFVLAGVDGKDATYTIKDDAESYLGSDNEWNSKAISDASDVYAQWNVSADSDHLFFKNLGGKKDADRKDYLGADKDNTGIWTDKNTDNVYTYWRLQEAIKGEPEIVFDPEAKNLLLNGDFQAEGWTAGSDVTDVPSWAPYVSDNTENRDWIGNVTMLVDSTSSNVALNMAAASGCTWWGGFIGVEQEVELTVGEEYVLAFDYMFDNSKQASWHARVIGTEKLLDKSGNAVKTAMTQSLNKFTADTTKVKVQFYVSNDFNTAAGAARNFTLDNVVLYNPKGEPEKPDTTVVVEVNALSQILTMADGDAFKMNPTLLITHTGSVYDDETEETTHFAYVYDDKTFGLMLGESAIGDDLKNIADGWEGVVVENNCMKATSELIIVDGHLELPAPTVVENADFTGVYPHQYVKVEGVTFDEATPAASDEEFTGKVGEKEISFGNVFKLESQEAATYTVIGYAEIDGEDMMIFPVQFTDKQAGISSIEAENVPAVYYNLQGVKIDAPAAGSIVIKVQGGNSAKIVVR